MRVLGIEIISADPCWVVLDGDNHSGSLEIIEPSRQRLPTSEIDEVGNLLQLKQLVTNTFRNKNIEKIGLIRAGKQCSPLRCKVEFIIQYACKELGLPCLLVPPQTIHAVRERKVHQVTGSSLIEIYNGGSEIDPRYLEKAAYCAWSDLNAN
jgi:hypothetical protein